MGCKASKTSAPIPASPVQEQKPRAKKQPTQSVRRQMTRSVGSEGHTPCEPCEKCTEDLVQLLTGEDAQDALPDCISGDGDTVYSFTVYNESSVELTGSWIDYDGAAQVYFTVAPGESITQETYVTHVWVFKNPDDEVAVILNVKYEIKRKNTVIEVDIFDGFEATSELPEGFMIKCIKDTKQDGAQQQEPEEHEELVEAVAESDAVKEAIDFVNSVLEAGEPWTDPDFPPCIQSIRKDNETQSALDLPDTWKRAPQIQKSVGVFKDGPSWEDIHQGQLGDCYFLAAIASIAEFPDFVRARFITKRVNKCGIYAVSVFINGEEKIVIVDDHFLVDEWGRPQLAKFANGKMWVAIIEKVWCKLMGSISRADGGYSTDPMVTFSGKPAYSLLKSETDHEVIFERMRVCDQKNYAIMASSNSHPDGDAASVEGIVQGHSYSVLSCHVVEHNGPLRLIKLRNPWSDGEWTGAWCDTSDLWTDELKELLGWSKKDDGIFFMNFEDFFIHFSIIDFAVLNHSEPYPKKRLYMDQKKQGFFKITLDEAYDCSSNIFAVNWQQLGDRHGAYRRVENTYQLSDDMKIKIYSITDPEAPPELLSQNEDVTSNGFMRSAIIRDRVLEAGSYFVEINITWNEAANNDPAYKDSVVELICKQDAAYEAIDPVEAAATLVKTAWASPDNEEWFFNAWVQSGGVDESGSLTRDQMIEWYKEHGDACDIEDMDKWDTDLWNVMCLSEGKESVTWAEFANFNKWRGY